MSTVTTLTDVESTPLGRVASFSSSTRQKSAISGQSVQPRATPEDARDLNTKSPMGELHAVARQPQLGIRIREHHEPERIELEDMPALPVLDAEPAASSSTGGGKIEPPSGPDFTMSVRDERIYLATLCYNLATAGWNDGTLGPLLPRIQEHYHIGYTVVSMLFVVGCIGFMAGALSNIYLFGRLGFGKTITLAAATQIGAYTMMAVAPPFPVFCLAMFFNGWAISLQDAGSNSFVASIPRNEKVNMGVLHAIYGVGAFASPFVATQFSQQKHWSFQYLISAGISIINVALLFYVFRLKPQSQTSHSESQQQPASENLYKQVLKQKSVHIMSFFILVYVGVEVTIGGWIVTYLLKERGAGPSAGYVSSGFFGGLTLGRLVLLPVNDKIGHERVIYLYSILAIALEFTVWFVPNLIGNAVAVSLVGLLLGPFYPIAMNVIAGLIPRWLLAGSIGWIGAFGPIGAALFPFMTGALASKSGVQVLQPLLIGMMGAQIVLWFFVTRSKVSRED
ncbi:hypothetical protein FRC04_001254 [Tulasnella sp. 424]|nr:hypothetical protein FRC04_001254 [Tulasnella sp. 424]KAG8970495.1 hypothetical protein FRC05_000603 [Tulasnella sp. 425]